MDLIGLEIRGHPISIHLCSHVLFQSIKLCIAKQLGSVWNPESTREKKKSTKENDFRMFGFIVEKKKKSNIIKISQSLTYF